jgi:hypothetical protein
MYWSSMVILLLWQKKATITVQRDNLTGEVILTLHDKVMGKDMWVWAVMPT